MGLSQDPEKRANQLRNLRGGWPRAEQKHGLVKPEPQPDHEPEPAAEPEPGRLEVIDYDSPAPEPQPAEKPAGKPARQRRAPKQRRAATPAAAPAPEPERESGGGFWKGFLGG